MRKGTIGGLGFTLGLMAGAAAGALAAVAALRNAPQPVTRRQLPQELEQRLAGLEQRLGNLADIRRHTRDAGFYQRLGQIEQRLIDTARTLPDPLNPRERARQWIHRAAQRIAGEA